MPTPTNPPTLPKGVSLASFQRAASEYRKALGDANVIIDAAQLAPYAKIMIPEANSLHQPAGALLAHSVEHVKKVLAIANKHKTPVWPISTGRNFGYGSAAPATPGQLVLDMRSMNKIIDIDEKLCTALVEPGVTYQQLIDYIDEHKLPLWASFPASSVLAGPMGNTLDRGVGYNRNAEHFANFCGLEVVLANGETMRTGLGSVGGGHVWQHYRWGFGPWVDGLFSQSNMGIVTKMGLWLMRKPEAYQMFSVSWESIEAAAKGAELAAQMKLDGQLDSVVVGEALYSIGQRVRRADIYSGPGSIPEDIWAAYRKKHKIPLYSLVSTLYGSREEIDLRLRRLKLAFEKDGGIFATGDALVGNPDAEHAERLSTGRPDLDEFGVYNFRGGGGSAWFAPVVPARAADMVKSSHLCDQIFRKHGLDYMGGFIVNPRSAEHVVEMVYNRADPEETKRAYACFKESLIEHAKLGYGVYRTNTAFMNLAADTYGPAQRAFNQRLKRSLDPNGIIAPGKSGIFI